MRRKILVLEDELTMRTFLYCFLKAFYDVVVKPNAVEALNWLKAGNEVDLIISDVDMPGIDGFRFLNALQEYGNDKKVPVILLTAKSKSEDRIRGLKLGAYDYMTKPFNPEELQIRIQRALN